jgi:hypothetical protein
LRICTSIGDPHPAAAGAGVAADADRNRDLRPVRALRFVGFSNGPFPFHEMVAGIPVS